MSAELGAPLKRVCDALALSDDEMGAKIREVIVGSPFAGEGHRKVTARLRRNHGIRVGRKRVLRLNARGGFARAPAEARTRAAEGARRHDHPSRAEHAVGHRRDHGLHAHRRLGLVPRADRCSGCAERFIRTLKEQVIWVKLYDTVEELADAIGRFTMINKVRNASKEP